MNTNKKILLIVATMLIALMTATIINVAINFRDFSYKSAIDKSKITAEIVRDGLTTHMLNDIMPNRNLFLKNISSYDNVKSLWIVRSPKVDSQYGPGLPKEEPKDAMDKEVLQTGKMLHKITETSDKAQLRVSIPYIASAMDTPNCMKCHHVNEGDVLGVVSMEFDISDTRFSGMLTIVKIFALNVIFIIIALFLTNHYFKPYMRIFSDLTDMITHANNGDFSYRITRKISGDGAEVVSQINKLFANMQETFSELKSNLTTFVSRSNFSCADPLEESKTIIHELADVYKFKKTIELDPNKDAIYERVYYILKEKFNIHHFSFFEVNKSNKERTLLYSTEEEEQFCNHNTMINALECRAVRTDADVISTDFSGLCQNCKSSQSEYTCIPFNINEDVSLVINILSDDKEKLDLINQDISMIKSYLDAMKPVVESRILMEKLRDSSLRDGLTGLYNRRFLEEYIDQEQAHILREKINYDIMMIDIDFFKLVNDNYGHDVGDTVIKALSDILQGSIRDSDMAIRYGGEEFLILLRHTTPEATMKIASNIHTTFRQRKFTAGNETIEKTLSIGIAKLPEDGDSIWKVIKYADTALYSAKNTGRDKIVEFTSDMFEEY